MREVRVEVDGEVAKVRVYPPEEFDDLGLVKSEPERWWTFRCAIEVTPTPPRYWCNWQYSPVFRVLMDLFNELGGAYEVRGVHGWYLLIHCPFQRGVL